MAAGRRRNKSLECRSAARIASASLTCIDPAGPPDPILSALRFSTRSMVIHRRTMSLGILFMGGLCLGMAPVIVKSVALAPEISAFYRVLLAAPAFAAFAWLFPATPTKVASSPPRAFILLYALTAISFAADLALMHVSIRMTNVALATLFTNCAPFFVGLMGLFGLSDRPTRRFWQALPVALLGILLLIGLSGLSDGAVAGNLLGLCAGMFYGGYLVCVRALRARGAPPAVLMVWVSAGSAALLAPLFVAAGAPVPADPRTWALLAVLVLAGQVAGQGLVTIALRELPASLGSIVLLIQPVAAAGLSWALLSETLSGLQVFGMALVLVAIGTATMAPSISPKDVSANGFK